MIKISKRLEAISSLVPVNSKIIDVGCDHGLLDIYLYQKKISNKIIATDINKNALNNAKDNIKKNNLTEYIETRIGSGLNPLTEKDDIDTIIMSGLGAHTIVDILKKNSEKLKNINTILIQSNTKFSLLRSEIVKLNYKIADETIVIDKKKTYIVIKFVKGKAKYSKKELYFGPVLLKNNSQIFKEYKQKELAKLNTILNILPKNKILDYYKLKKEIQLYK